MERASVVLVDERGIAFSAPVVTGSNGVFRVPLPSAGRIHDLLNAVAGVNIGRRGNADFIEIVRAGSIQAACRAITYVDGVRTQQSILLELDISDIEAIEVYKGASSIPLEFGGHEARCGIVAAWTRRGRS